MKPAGYLLNTPDGLVGERGFCYDYVLASNGLWIEAEGQFMAARILTAPAEVRGLLPLEQKVVLRHGSIEAFKLELLLNLFSVNPGIEHYAAIIWDGSKYDIRCPEQQAERTSVQYEQIEEAVMDRALSRVHVCLFQRHRYT